MADIVRFPSSTRVLEIKTDEPECFRCDTHSEGILKVLQDRLDLCDVVLLVGDKRISTHRQILIACSEYFSVLLSEPVGESQTREITLNEIDADALEQLVHYCYTGCLELRGDTIEVLLTTANHLRLKKVVEACCEFLQRHREPSNWLALASLAEQLNLDALLHNTRKIICENFEEVSNYPDFFLLSAKQVCELIASDDLDVPSEEFLFEVLMKWIEYEPEDRRKHFTELLAQVRLPLLPPTFLAEKVEPLCNTTESQKLFVNALKSHLLLTSNSTQPRNHQLKNVVKHLLAIFPQSTEEYHNLAIAGYNLRTKMWSVWNTQIEYREWRPVALMNDNLIMVGGYSNGSPLNTVICLNLHTMYSSEIAPVDTPRDKHMIAILNGLIYVIGGHDGRQVINSVERWDPVDRTWKFVASMTNARQLAGVAVINDKLYVSGGHSGIEFLSSVERYDPVENIWRSIAPMKVERFSHCLAVHKGSMFAIGGHNSVDQADSIERYDPRTDTWTTISCSQTISGYTTCASLGPDLFIYNNINIYMISSESSCDNLELQILPKTANTFIKFNNTELFAIPYEINPSGRFINYKEF